MTSKLKLLILENPTVDFVLAHIDAADRNRLEAWYEKSAHTGEDIRNISEVFLWCCTEGKNAADTQDHEVLIEACDQKAKDLGVSREVVSSLYFSHAALLDGSENIDISCSDTPVFVVFEGLDGSGKSTQIRMLKDRLKAMGRKVCVTAEPTESATGGLIRDALSNNYKREASELAGLFLTDRISHNVNPVWGIKKFLGEGTDVICDRYYYSSFAYQGLEADLNWIMDMNLHCPQIIKPDLCIYLDVDPQKCKRRIDSERAHLEIFEHDAKMMEQTRRRFFEVFERLRAAENIRIIDADKPLNAVSDEIFKIVMGLKQKRTE